MQYDDLRRNHTSEVDTFCQAEVHPVPSRERALRFEAFNSTLRIGGLRAAQYHASQCGLWNISNQADTPRRSETAVPLVW